jgi:hypothetical protein
MSAPGTKVPTACADLRLSQVRACGARVNNARLTDELTRELVAHERTTGQSRSEIVRAALERYFDDARPSARSASDAIDASGLVGCGEAETDLSATHKSRLRESMERKHGHR